jgi:NitT/TauT family transport system ATP-binding protein
VSASGLRLKGIQKVFPGRRGDSPETALDGVDLAVNAGEFLAVVGPSGCGKSTLLNIIAGLESPTMGEVWMGERRISGPGSDRGVVFQDYALFPWKVVIDNVAFGLKAKGLPKDERNRIAREYLNLVGLKGADHKYPHELSGGMRQRCALARALANDPEVLLMDEPLAAVDAQTRQILQRELLSIWGEDRPTSTRKTVIFITHSIDEAVFLADRIVVMASKPGRIRTVLQNPLPRPRVQVKATLEYATFSEQIWALIEKEVYASTFQAN